MLGAIIGDIAGSYYEVLEYNATKNTPHKKRSVEERMQILNPEIPLFNEHSSYTDDTILTIAIASSLLKKESYETSLRSFGTKEINYGKDLYGRSRFGSGFVKWLKNESLGDSYGNGAAMRVSPIAYYYDDLSKILEESKKATIPSHNTKEAINGAEAVSSAIYLARTKHTKEEIKKYIEENFNYCLDYDLSNLIANYQFSSRTSESVPQAIYCFLISTSFEDALRKSLAIGGDSDTIADITGAISEAYYGIPEKLKDQALSYLPPAYQKITSSFYEEISLKKALQIVGIDDSNFLSYMKNNTKVYDVPASTGIWGCFIDRHCNSTITRVRIIVPRIKDEQTLLINIHEYTHAYEIYQHLGTIYYESLNSSEKRARSNEEKYLKKVNPNQD